MPASRTRRRVRWPEIARRVAALLPWERVPIAVRRVLEADPSEKEGGAEPAALAIAFSGGADSLALLLTLWAHLPAERSRWRVLHFDHRLRGRESTNDARFCRAVCRALGVRTIVGRSAWRAGTAVNEAAAREARLEFFATEMQRVGARVLLLGHQRDDVAETMLLRLSRGAGLSGLAAPRAVHRQRDGTIRVRPLLEFSKAELRGALEAAGAGWRDDRTNAERNFLRNRMRLDVLPRWRRAVPAGVDLDAAIARSRVQLEEDDDALESWAARVLESGAGSEGAIAGWAGLPVAVVRRALHRWWLATVPGVELERALADQLVAAIAARESRRFSAGPAGFVVLDATRMRLVPAAAGDAASFATPAPGLRLALPGSWRDASGAELVATPVAWSRRREWPKLVHAADIGSQVFLGSPMKQREPLLVRSWQPGDRYQAFGSNHVTKLQDQFTNRRISRVERHRLPVVCASNGDILWVPGLPPAEGTRVTPASRSLVQLTYHPPHPRSHPQDV